MSDAADFARIARAIEYIVAHADEQPDLAACARAAGLSPYHFQRLFQRFAGVSPKRFLQVLTLRAAREHLARERSVLDAALAVGLSGPGRLHDLFVAIERLTPGEYKAQAEGLTIVHDLVATPLGPALVAAAPRGLVHVAFVDAGEPAALAELRARWPRATLVRDPAAIAPYAKALRARLRGREHEPIGLVLKGTPLQLAVWQALLAVPPGAVVSYGGLAAAAGHAGAVRAVASAVGANPIAALIPCHRVIRATGAFGEYAWGTSRKLALLGAELGRAGEAAPAATAR